MIRIRTDYIFDGPHFQHAETSVVNGDGDVLAAGVGRDAGEAINKAIASAFGSDPDDEVALAIGMLCGLRARMGRSSVMEATS